MNDAASRHARRLRERADILIVLLLIQGIVGLVGLLGLLVIGIVAGFPVATPAGAVALAGFVVPLLLVAGVARGSGWVRRAVTIYETLALLSVFVNLVLALSPDVEMDLTLTGLLTGVVLPVAIIALLNPSEPAAVTASTAPPCPTDRVTSTPAGPARLPAVEA